MRTLTHEWRNVLNGINLRICSAQAADSESERKSDLGEAQQLIVEATGLLTALSRRLAPPSVTLIPYPTEYFLEDMAVILEREVGLNAAKLKWKNGPVSGKIMVDFVTISQAMSELIGNTLRYLFVDDVVVISSHEAAGFLVLSWREPIFGNPTIENWGKLPFYTTERGRMGLGLYFAQRVFSAHQGTLQFEIDKTTQTLQTTLRIPLAVE